MGKIAEPASSSIRGVRRGPRVTPPRCANGGPVTRQPGTGPSPAGTRRGGEAARPTVPQAGPYGQRQPLRDAEETHSRGRGWARWRERSEGAVADGADERGERARPERHHRAIGRRGVTDGHHTARANEIGRDLDIVTAVGAVGGRGPARGFGRHGEPFRSRLIMATDAACDSTLAWSRAAGLSLGDAVVLALALKESAPTRPGWAGGEPDDAAGGQGWPGRCAGLRGAAYGRDHAGRVARERGDERAAAVCVRTLPPGSRPTHRWSWPVVWGPQVRARVDRGVAVGRVADVRASARAVTAKARHAPWGKGAAGLVLRLPGNRGRRH